MKGMVLPNVDIVRHSGLKCQCQRIPLCALLISSINFLAPTFWKRLWKWRLVDGKYCAVKVATASLQSIVAVCRPERTAAPATDAVPLKTSTTPPMNSLAHVNGRAGPCAANVAYIVQHRAAGSRDEM